jgi:outer membrane protein assembly factor BamD
MGSHSRSPGLPATAPTKPQWGGRPAHALAFWIGLLLFGAGCSAFETNLQDTNVDYLDTARQNYEAAEQALENKRFNEAIKYFEFVKNKYPYSRYAVLAELRLADSHFAREKWLEAADAYRIFVRFHPRHEQVAYATFRIAESHSRAIESNVTWLPFIDPMEKDQSSARDTVRAADDFLTRFPNDERVAEAKRLRTEARARLAEVDLYAADFYESRQRWQGAVWRYEKVANEFSDTPRAPFALAKAATLVQDRLGDPRQARTLWERLLNEHPEADEAVLAKQALQSP